MSNYLTRTWESHRDLYGVLIPKRGEIKSLKNTFIEVNSVEEYRTAVDFLMCCGYSSITGPTWNFRDIRGYVGVKDGNISAYSLGDVISINGFRIINLERRLFENKEEFLSYAGETVYCETPEIAIYLGLIARDLGLTWNDGSEYVYSNNMYFRTRHIGRGVSYNFNRGVFSADKPGVSEHLLAQKLLFNTSISIMAEEVKEGIFETLIPKRNSIYVVIRPMPVDYDSSNRRVIFRNKNINDKKPYLGAYGAYKLVRNLVEGYEIAEATNSEKREFRLAERLYRDRQREESIANRNYRIEMRPVEKREYNKRGYMNFNTDIKTQLISESLHKALYKKLDNRIAKTLLKANSLGYFRGITRHITIKRSTGEMTYTPSNKEQEITDNGTWCSKGRQSGKIGKVLRKVLTEHVPKFKYKDCELEELVNFLKGEFSNGSFSIVQGYDIEHWYSEEQYAPSDDTGTLGYSCMRHNPEYMQLYSNNPEVCKMVILVKNDMLCGRALLWKDKYMDRIYGSDSTIAAFKNYARENNYHYKQEQNSNCIEEWVNPETGESYDEEFKIDVRTDFDYYPYADTFYIINTDKGFIANSDRWGKTGDLRSTYGDYESSGVWDDIDECYIDQGESVWLEYRDENTHVDNTFYCAIENEYFLTDDMVRLPNGDCVYKEASGIVYVDSLGDYDYEDNTFDCEYDNEIYSYSDTNRIYIEELEIDVAEHNVEAAYEEAGYHYQDGSWIKVVEEEITNQTELNL